MDINAVWAESCRTVPCHLCGGPGEDGEVLAVDLEKSWLYICAACGVELIRTLLTKGIHLPIVRQQEDR